MSYPGSGWSSAEGPGRKIWGGGAGAGGAGLLIAFINHADNGGSNTPPSDISTHPWTHGFFTGNFADNTQFPGPGGTTSMALWYRAVVPGEGAAVLTIAAGAGDVNSVWVYQIRGATLAGLQLASGIDSVPYVNGAEVAEDSPSAAVNSVWLGSHQLQKVNYGEFTVMPNADGTALADCNGANTPTVGQCGVPDPSPPTVHIGYRIGTGVLRVGSTFTACCGSGPGCYNLFGRGFGGILLPLLTTFGIVQQGFNVRIGADCTVTLPAPP